MVDEDATIFTLNIGTDKRTIESGIRVKKTDLEGHPDAVKEQLKTHLSKHLTLAVDQLFGPQSETAETVEEPKPVEEKKEEPKEEPKVEEKKEEPKEEAAPKKEEAKEEPKEEKKDAA